MMMNVASQQVRRLTTGRTKDVACSVFISQSKEVFANLALEDWLYRNFNFEKHRVLLLWRNTPCVVIGRHQNPWIEADINYLKNEGILMARRNSGGGTVYQDMALKNGFGIDAEISSREDITLNGKKISGTAAKLGKNAYHHCTLLIDADVTKMSNALTVNKDNYNTKATGSVKSSVTSLRSTLSSVNVDDVMEAVGMEYLASHDTAHSRGYTLINPTDGWFPGIRDLKQTLRSWEWTFGKTPRFCVAYSIPVTADGFPDSHIQETQNEFTSNKLQIIISVVNGIMNKIELDGPSRLLGSLSKLSIESVRALQGERYCCNMTSRIEQRLMATTSASEAMSAPVCGDEGYLIDTPADDISGTVSEEEMKQYLKM